MERHLLSDVPVGILVSGGLDSGLLLALMNEHGREWPAYTVGYGETFEDDELSGCGRDRRHSGRPSHSGSASIGRNSNDRFRRSLAAWRNRSRRPRLFRCTLFASAPAQDVKVVLIGQGRTSCSAATSGTSVCGTVSRGGAFPPAIRGLIRGAVNRLPRNETLKRGVYSLGIDDRLKRYQHVFSLAPAETITGLFRDGLLPPGRSTGRLLDGVAVADGAPRRDLQDSSCWKSARRCRTNF